MASKYELLEKIGEGGAGSVFRARAPGGAIVAVKLLKKLDSPKAVARFEREQRLLRQLGELEGFVPLLDAGTGPTGPWLVMPFLGGGTLRELIARRPRLTVAEAVAVTGRISAAMGRAHARGLVHRDLKPENVLFSHRGSGAGDVQRPLVADLGLAKHWRHDVPGGSLSIALSRPGEFAGTAGYTAPEQMLSSRDALPTADVFSLGAILYECLSARYAFPGETFAEVVSNVQSRALRSIVELVPACPDELAAIIDRALTLDPAQRFADGSALARALAACPLVRPGPGARPILVDSTVEDPGVPASTVEDSRPTGASVFEWVEPGDPHARWGRVLIGGALVLAAVVVLVGVSLTRARQLTRERDRVEANVREIHRLAQLARERGETAGPQSAAAADEALALFAALPPERRERALEAEAREAAAWGQLALGADSGAVAAAGSALALLPPDSPVVGSLQLLRARAFLRAGRTDEGLKDLAGATSLEARRLRTQTLLALRRWGELEDLAAGTDDFLRSARAWARFRLSKDAGPAREELESLGPGARESLAGALRLAEARARLVALRVPDDATEIVSRPARPFEALESFANLLLAAWRSPHRALLDRDEDSAALEHAFMLAISFARVFADLAGPRVLVCADHLEEAVGLVDVAGTKERGRDTIWLAQLFETILGLNRFSEVELGPRRAAQAERLTQARALPGDFGPEVEHARRRAWAMAVSRLRRLRKATPEVLVEALEQALAAPPPEGTLFIDYPLVEGIWRWTLVDALARVAAPLESGVERERLLAEAEGELPKLRKIGTATGAMRTVNQVDFLEALVRGADARAEALLVGFDLAPRSDASALEQGLAANELFLAGELRRRQGRPAEALPLLELSVRIRAVPANADNYADVGFVADPLLAHALVLLGVPARRDEGLARLERLLAKESDYPPALPWLEAEAHAAVGK